MELINIKARKAYLDTNIFIYAIEGVEDYQSHINALFQHLQTLNCELITSDLTLAECLVKPLQNRDNRSVELYENHIKDADGMSVVAVSKNILKEAAQNKADLRNKLPDAIHIATALNMGCEIFVTNDAKIKVPDGIQAIILKELQLKS